MWRPQPEVIGRRGIGRVVGARTAVSHAAWFDRILSRELVRTSPDVCIAFASFALRSFEKAKCTETITILERGSMHCLALQKSLLAESIASGIQPPTASARMLERELAEYEVTSYVSVPSSQAARSFVDNGVEPKKILVNPYGVDLRRFHPRKSASAGAGLELVTVGNLGLEKGTHRLVEAVSILNDPAVRLRLIGTVSPSIRRRIVSAETRSRFDLAGVLHGPPLTAAYQSADLLVLPSIQEGMSLAVLEALACGTPAIVSARAGYEPAPAVTVIPAGDTNAIVEAIEALRGSAADLRGEARRYACESSWEHYGVRLAMMLAEVAGS
jgi:glycosyltransferase involved in cell wall biosynthesis